MERRVVITGIGVVSPVGIGRDAYWEGIFLGARAFNPITLFDTSSLPIHMAGEIDSFDPETLLGKKGLRTLDRSTLLINSAAKLALDDANLQITEDNAKSVGVSVGTTFGSLHSISQFDREGLIEGPKLVNPSHFPNTVINSPASQVSIRFKIKGFNTTISTGFCASLDAVSYAVDFIRLNRAEVVLAGGVEELSEETLFGFFKLGCLSGADGSEPICCPFDARRNGAILAEGAAVLVLEEEQHALGRGASIFARVAGCGNAFDPDANRNFAHAGHGLRTAVTCALKDASLSPEKIDHISACANSTKELDRIETKVIKDIFGKRAFDIPVSSTKSMVGESFSASGALSLAASVGALVKEIVPPTMNYREKDPDCDLDYVPNEARRHQSNNVLVTSSDSYGQNTAIILGKFWEA